MTSTLVERQTQCLSLVYLLGLTEIGFFAAVPNLKRIANRDKSLEWPVLSWVPEVCGPFLYLNSQSVRLGIRQKVHNLKADPEVAFNWSKPNFVANPSTLPVEVVAHVLVNDDPTKYRIHRFRRVREWHHNWDGDSKETYATAFNIKHNVYRVYMYTQECDL